MKRSPASHRTRIVLAWILVVSLGATAVWLSPPVRERVAENRCGQQHVFPIKNTRTFLPDDVALNLARQALEAQGFNTNRWLPETYSRTWAPDGTKDRFLCRNKIDDRRGIITFTNRHSDFRWVNVEATNGAVVCVVQPARKPL